MLFKKEESTAPGNKFLNIVTVVTVALSVLIVSVFMLFYTNVQSAIDSWRQGVRMQVYLEEGLDQKKIQDAKIVLDAIPNVTSSKYVSKQEAFSDFKKQLHRQEGMLEGIAQNPLPDSFELQIGPTIQDVAQIEAIAVSAGKVPGVTDVEYGKQWVNRFVQIFSLFRVISISMAILFSFAAIFIVSNTVRLTLYSRYTEVEIMRLVGVPNNYIKRPFYTEGMLLGGIGGAIGIFLLLGIYTILSQGAGDELVASAIQIHFLPIWVCFGLWGGSILVGLLGSHLSVYQFFKDNVR